ncbi:MAG: OmpA family protein, partial [Maribacter dokdonensis]
MKKVVLFTFMLMASFAVKAQSYIGFLTDNYSGVNSVISNPANIADSRFKTDINLIGASGFLANDYVGVGYSDLVSSDFDYDTDALLTLSDNNNFSGNVDVLGPSFMFNVGRKSSIAIFTRARSFVTGNEFNGESIDDLDDSIDESQDFLVNEGDFFAAGHGWAEVGITYAQELMNKEEHFLKGGLSFKYLKGFGNAYVAGRNVTIDYDADGATLPDNSTIGTLASTGDLIYGRADQYDVEDYDYEVP